MTRLVRGKKETNLEVDVSDDFVGLESLITETVDGGDSVERFENLGGSSSSVGDGLKLGVELERHGREDEGERRGGV